MARAATPLPTAATAAPADRQRVLLVEDEPMLVRFVEMALEDLPIDITVCSTVAEAVESLRRQAVRLVVTDLMLPGDSGFVLLERLQQDPGLRAGALVAVFSAGLSPEVLAQLQPLGVWRTISKPTSVRVLQACIADALAAGQAPRDAAAPAAGADASVDTEATAIRTHFAGDATLFRAYREACLRQFPHDCTAGDAALSAQDLQELRRLVHSLGTVLLTLGRAEEGQAARLLEDAANRADAATVATGWPLLRARLLLLAGR